MTLRMSLILVELITEVIPIDQESYTNFTIIALAIPEQWHNRDFFKDCLFLMRLYALETFSMFNMMHLNNHLLFSIYPISNLYLNLFQTSSKYFRTAKYHLIVR